MVNKQLSRTESKALAQTERQLTEREILLQIVKLQMQFNSKLFEFMRDYQREQDFGLNRFRDGSGRKTKIARLHQEVNELGAALSKLTSMFIGQEVFEKRDENGRLLVHCKNCKTETPFVQVIDSPHGIVGAYMDGTERLVCSVCKKDSVYPGDERLPKINSIFRTK